MLGSATFAVGKVGQAFSFDGLGDMEAPSAPILNPTGQVTLEAWVYIPPAGMGQQGHIFGKYSSFPAQQQYLISKSVGNRFVANVGVSGGTVSETGSQPINANQWYHVAMTYDGSNLRLYVNGAPDGTTAASGAINAGGQPVRIGGAPSPTLYLNGRVDEASLYNQALSAADLQAIYQADTLGKCKSAAPATPTDTPAATNTPTPTSTATNTPTSTPTATSTTTHTPTRTPTSTRTATNTPAPPPGPCTLSGSKSESNVVLSWTAASGATGYRIYRGTTPYFHAGTPYATTGALTYTDTGVMGDPAINYYYLVRAYSSGGETQCANRVGAFEYQLTAGPSGDYALNDIAIPLDVSAAGITDAESLATWLETEDGAPFGSVAQLLKWDAPTQSFLAWSHQYGFGDNFPAQTGDYIYLVVDQNTPRQASFVGRVPQPGEVLFGLAPGLSGMCALNFPSLPLDQSALTDADRLSDAIGIPDVTVLQALDWDAPTQNFFAWSNEFGFGDNFPTTIGYPYIVCLSENGVPTSWP
jgi:hypothetical protein